MMVVSKIGCGLVKILTAGFYDHNTRHHCAEIEKNTRLKLMITSGVLEVIIVMKKIYEWNTNLCYEHKRDALFWNSVKLIKLCPVLIPKKLMRRG